MNPDQTRYVLLAFVLLGKAGQEIGLALALLGGQVRHSRRVPLPVGMAVDLRIAKDSGIDAGWRTGQHGEIECVTRTGIDLDDPSRHMLCRFEYFSSSQMAMLGRLPAALGLG